jgi:hypothetical protein
VPRPAGPKDPELTDFRPFAAELTGGSVDAVIAWEYPAYGGYGMAPVGVSDVDFAGWAEKTAQGNAPGEPDPAGSLMKDAVQRPGGAEHLGDVLPSIIAGAGNVTSKARIWPLR